jgi:hypothetical protein
MDRHPVKSSKLVLGGGGGCSHTVARRHKGQNVQEGKRAKSMEIYWIIEALTLRDDRYFSGDVM